MALIHPLLTLQSLKSCYCALSQMSHPHTRCHCPIPCLVEDLGGFLHGLATELGQVEQYVADQFHGRHQAYQMAEGGVTLECPLAEDGREVEIQQEELQTMGVPEQLW